MNIFLLNLMYGDLDKDIQKLRTYALTLHSVDPGLEDSIENVISALTKYKNMYHSEYVHHMNYKRNHGKAVRRADMYSTENVILKELLDEHNIEWRKFIRWN